MYTVYGGSVDFLFNTLGIYSFVNELDIDPFDVFGLYRDEAAEKEALQEDEDLQHWRSLLNDLNRMFYHERVLLGEQYTKLKPYKHPLFGDIYIGGVKKFGQRVSPLFKLAETCHRNTAFCLFHADQLARLAFDKIKVKKLGNRLYQLDVTIANSRVTPSISYWAKQKKLHRADRFKVAGSGVKLLAAGLLTDPFRGTSKKIECRKNFFWMQEGVPGFGKVDFRLLIKGNGSVSLIYDSLKGGLLKQSVHLK